MSDPRYRPRDFTLEPEGFGRVETLRWKTTGTIALENSLPWETKYVAPALLAAAQFQHNYVLRIRAGLKHEDVTLKEYATIAGTSYDRLVKVLRGAVILRLEDIAMADEVLVPVSEFAREKIATETRAKVAAAASAAYLSAKKKERDR